MKNLLENIALTITVIFITVSVAILVTDIISYFIDDSEPIEYQTSAMAGKWAYFDSTLAKQEFDRLARYCEMYGPQNYEEFVACESLTAN